MATYEKVPRGKCHEGEGEGEGEDIKGTEGHRGEPGQNAQCPRRAWPILKDSSTTRKGSSLKQCLCSSPRQRRTCRFQMFTRVPDGPAGPVLPGLSAGAVRQLTPGSLRHFETVKVERWCGRLASSLGRAMPPPPLSGALAYSGTGDHRGPGHALGTLPPLTEPKLGPPPLEPGLDPSSNPLLPVPSSSTCTPPSPPPGPYCGVSRSAQRWKVLDAHSVLPTWRRHGCIWKCILSNPILQMACFAAQSGQSRADRRRPACSRRATRTVGIYYLEANRRRR